MTATAAETARPAPRLKQRYRAEIVPLLMEQFGYGNVMQVPRVTLRGDRMWEFLDRLISIALPRIRDFRGLSPNSFDGRGNYSLGIREQIIFPEIDYDQIAGIRGLDVAITTTAETDEQGLALLRALGMPFQRESEGENQ